LSECNTASKIKGKLCPCRLGLGHLGQHEYKEPNKKDDMSNEGSLIGFAICTGILVLFYFTATEQWIQPAVWYNPIGWGLAILTTFGAVGWLVCLGTLISNFYWSRKQDEIWIKNKNPDPRFSNNEWIKNKEISNGK